MKTEKEIREMLEESLKSQKEHHKNKNLRGEIENNVAVCVLAWVLEEPVIIKVRKEAE